MRPPSEAPTPRRCAALARAPWAALIVAFFATGGCAYNEIHKQCPTCVIVSKDRPASPIPDGTRTVYLLVPGILGFGWEWDAPVAALRLAPGAAVQVFDWRPTSPLTHVSRELARVADDLWAAAPASVERMVIVGHSAGGIVTAYAAAAMHVPAGRETLVVNVGAPYAGMGIAGDGPADFINTLFVAAIGQCFRHYPLPARGVRFESWVTSPTSDPVMKVRYGHHPDDPLIGPPGPRIRLPEQADHNEFLGDVIHDVIARASATPGANDAASHAASHAASQAASQAVGRAGSSPASGSMGSAQRR